MGLGPHAKVESWPQGQERNAVVVFTGGGVLVGARGSSFLLTSTFLVNETGLKQKDF